MNLVAQENRKARAGESNSSEAETSNTATEEYGLQQSGILSNNSATDWESIKNEVEIFYYIVPTVTVDLYSMNIDKNEILSFNKELDNLTVAVKDENKEEVLKRLASLYGYLPKYAQNLAQDTKYVNILATKANVFNAYALLDTDNWDGVIDGIKKAEESYTSVLNSTEYNGKENSINKVYIILNELENAASLKDRDIFLIKYKTFLDEIDGII